jgi:hypothetical protein
MEGPAAASPRGEDMVERSVGRLAGRKNACEDFGGFGSRAEQDLSRVRSSFCELEVQNCFVGLNNKRGHREELGPSCAGEVLLRVH